MKKESVLELGNLREIINITIEFTYATSYNRRKKNLDSHINKYIESGWKVIDILPKYSSLTGPDIYSCPEITYSLGWFNEEKAPHFELQVDNPFEDLKKMSLEDFEGFDDDPLF